MANSAQSRIERLERALAGPLPGAEAHRRLAPLTEEGRLRLIPHGEPGDVRAAVLVLLTWGPDGWELLLTERAASLRSHTGQLACPGGRLEPGESPIRAALREAWEETGLEPARVRVLGTLSPVRSPNSKGDVLPVVGVVASKPDLRLQESEVAHAFWIRLADLGEPRTELWELNGMRLQVPHWPVHRVPLWGLTAAIVAELVGVTGDG